MSVVGEFDQIGTVGLGTGSHLTQLLQPLRPIALEEAVVPVFLLVVSLHLDPAGDPA